MSPKSTVLLVVLFLVVIVGYSSVYVVTEMEKAIVLRFGEAQQRDTGPGIHLKVPFVEDVIKFDGRVLTLDAPPERYLTSEKKYINVNSFVKWKISEVEKYYTASSGDERQAGILLQQRVNKGLRDQFGRRTMYEVVSGERDQLMSELTRILDKTAQTELGIQVLDVRVKKIDLPEEVSQSVYSRMRSEREKEAREYRSQGKEAAEGIRADADRQKIVIEAEAYREAEKTRGEGDALAASIYAQAYTQNPDFYSFYRSINSYRETFANKGDVFLLSPESDFLKYLKSSSGANTKK